MRLFCTEVQDIYSEMEIGYRDGFGQEAQLARNLRRKIRE